METLVFLEQREIQEGWSDDRKYYAKLEDGKEVLYRTSPIQRMVSRQEEFRLMKRVEELGVPMCLPLSFGIEKEYVYTLYSWIHGELAENWIPKQSEEVQYRYGWDAGRILKKIHSLSPTEEQEPWESRFNKKIDKKLKSYKECPLQYPKGEKMVAYVEQNRHLLKGRPQRVQHGDYHVGNMMIEQERLVVIDFNRHDVGDPWEEFNRIPWCVEQSSFFASGMVDGYFDGNVPQEFWRLLALYICNNSLSSIPWAIPFGEEQVQVMMEQAKQILSWYQDMETIFPSWYEKRK